MAYEVDSVDGEVALSLSARARWGYLLRFGVFALLTFKVLGKVVTGSYQFRDGA